MDVNVVFDLWRVEDALRAIALLGLHDPFALRYVPAETRVQGADEQSAAKLARLQFGGCALRLLVHCYFFGAGIAAGVGVAPMPTSGVAPGADAGGSFATSLPDCSSQ